MRDAAAHAALAVGQAGSSLEKLSQLGCRFAAPCSAGRDRWRSAARSARRARAARRTSCCERRRVALARSHRGHVLGRFAAEEAPAGDQLPQHDAERVDVGRSAAGSVVGDFGRDVAGLGEDDAGDRVAAPVFPARGAEIDQLDVAAVADHHVLRAEIAVHDLERTAARVGALVHVRERFGKRDAESHRVRPSEVHAELRRARADLAQVSAFDVLDDDVGLAARIGRRFEDLGDPGVLELRLDPGLVEEARQKRAIVGVLAADDLDDAGSLGALDARRTWPGTPRPCRRGRSA